MNQSTLSQVCNIITLGFSKAEKEKILSFDCKPVSIPYPEKFATVYTAVRPIFPALMKSMIESKHERTEFTMQQIANGNLKDVNEVSNEHLFNFVCIVLEKEKVKV